MAYNMELFKPWIANKNKLLDAFAKGVSEKLFFKMSYPMWRKLAHNTDPTLEISRKSIQMSCESMPVVIYTVVNSSIDDEMEFVSDDNSFGKFLDMNFGTPTYTFKNKEAVLNSMYDSNEYLKYASNTSSSSAYVNGNASTSDSTTLNYDPTITSSDYWVTTSSSGTITWKTPCDEDDVRRICEDIINNKNKEIKKMDTSKMFNFDFGPAPSSQFRMSPYGLAVRTEKNGWIAYNAKTGDLMDVEVLNFDISKMIYKMPVALSAIKPGDILMHGGKPVFVRDIGTGTLASPTVNVIDYATASVMDILPVKSPFGFNFFTKVCPLIDMSGMTANPDNPFGNMLPFLMLNGENNDFDPTLLFLAGGLGNMDFSSNPMMLYFLMNRKDKGDILPFLMMMNGGNMFGANGVQAPVVTLK